MRRGRLPTRGNDVRVNPACIAVHAMLIRFCGSGHCEELLYMHRPAWRTGILGRMEDPPGLGVIPCSKFRIPAIVDAKHTENLKSDKVTTTKGQGILGIYFIKMLLAFRLDPNDNSSVAIVIAGVQSQSIQTIRVENSRCNVVELPPPRKGCRCTTHADTRSYQNTPIPPIQPVCKA